MIDQLTAKVEVEGVFLVIDAALLAKLLDIGLGETHYRMEADGADPELARMYRLGKDVWEWLDDYIKERRADGTLQDA